MARHSRVTSPAHARNHEDLYVGRIPDDRVRLQSWPQYQ